MAFQYDKGSNVGIDWEKLTGKTGATAPTTQTTQTQPSLKSVYAPSNSGTVNQSNKQVGVDGNGGAILNSNLTDLQKVAYGKLGYVPTNLASDGKNNLYDPTNGNDFRGPVMGNGSTNAQPSYNSSTPAQGTRTLSSLMGNGGANYNTADAATQQSIVDNEAKLADPNYRASEIQRAKEVIASRQGDNLDVTDQNNYLSKLMGYQDQSQGTQGTSSTSDLIDSIYNKNYAAQSQKLKSLRDGQLAGLAGQEDVINQGKINGLNANDVMANRNWGSLKELMANSGVNGGDSVTAQIGNQTAQQQGAVDINNQASNQLKQLMAQRAAINDNYSADDLALMQQLQATRDGQLLNQSNEDRSFGLQEGQLTGNYDPNSKVKQKMDANSAAWANASPEEKIRLHNENLKLAASIGGSDTTGNGDYNLPKAQRTLGGRQMEQQEAQRQWDNEFKGKQFDYQKASDLWERTFKEKSFDQSVKQFAANLGADYARMNQSQQQFVAEMAFKQKSFDMQNDPNSLDNQYKKAQIDKLKEPSSTSDKNAAIGGLTSSVEQMTPDNKTKFFKEQKSNIIAEYGISGYNQLYDMYFDKYGDPL